MNRYLRYNRFIAKKGTLLLCNFLVLGLQFIYMEASLAQGVPVGVDLRYENLRDKPERNLATPGNEFGDTHGMENGSLSFEIVDVSLPGNNALPVEMRRTMTVQKRSDARTSYGEGNIGEWQMALPNIQVTVESNSGWISSDPARPTKNCSISRSSFLDPPPAAVEPASFPTHTFWNAPKIYFPGGGVKTLAYNKSYLPAPVSGGPYYWATSNFDYISCLPTLKNPGTTAQEQFYGRSEGFLVLRPDGTKYWFDWVALNQKTPASSTKLSQLSFPAIFSVDLTQVTLALYPTRVEDKFGNWVIYTYTNKPNEPVSISKIESSDGRNITIDYSGGLISVAKSGNRIWIYSYGQLDSLGSKQLVKVVNPDSSTWEYSGSSRPNYSTSLQEPTNNGCDNYGISYWKDTQNFDNTTSSTPQVGTNYIVKSPSGATARFVMATAILGRSGVRINCYDTGFYSNGSGGFGGIISKPYLNVGGRTLVLVKKDVTGAGVKQQTWRYSYQSKIGFAPETDGTTVSKELSPDGLLTVRTFGNVFEQNDGLLLSEVQSKAGVTLSSTTRTYLARGTLADSSGFPKKIGDLPEYADHFTDFYLRPMISSRTEEQKTAFVWQVPSTCARSPASLCLDVFGRPIAIVKSAMPAL